MYVYNVLFIFHFLVICKLYAGSESSTERGLIRLSVHLNKCRRDHEYEWAIGSFEDQACVIRMQHMNSECIIISFTANGCEPYTSIASIDEASSTASPISMFTPEANLAMWNCSRCCNHSGKSDERSPISIFTPEANFTMRNCSGCGHASDKSDHKQTNTNEVIQVVVIIIFGCIIVALLAIVAVQRSQLTRYRNTRIHRNQLEGPTDTDLEMFHLGSHVQGISPAPTTNYVQDPQGEPTSETLEPEPNISGQRSRILMNQSNLIPGSTGSKKSASEVTQSLSTGDLATNSSSTIKSIGDNLKMWKDLKVPPARPHPDTSNIQTISTDIPSGPQECMNPRGERTTSRDRDPPSLGQWPIQFMMRVLRDKRKSK